MSQHCRPPRRPERLNRPTQDLTAHDLYLRAYAIVWVLGGSRFREALVLVEQAIAAIPTMASHSSFASILLLPTGVRRPQQGPTADGARSVELARRSLVVAPDDPTVMAHAANVLLDFGEDSGAMLTGGSRLGSDSELRTWLVHQRHDAEFGSARPRKASSMSSGRCA